MKTITPTSASITWRVYWHNPENAWFHQNMKGFCDELSARYFAETLWDGFSVTVEEHRQPQTGFDNGDQ